MVESTKNTAENEGKPTEEQSPDVPKVKRNWADDEDEHDDADGERAIGGTGSVAQVPTEEPEKPKIIPPKVKREKNAYGDFVVKEIFIKEREVPQVVNDESEEESSEEESEEEPEKEEVEEKSKCQIILTHHKSYL